MFKFYLVRVRVGKELFVKRYVERLKSEFVREVVINKNYSGYVMIEMIKNEKILDELKSLRDLYSFVRFDNCIEEMNDLDVKKMKDMDLVS